jgi:hypothetical protein
MKIDTVMFVVGARRLSIAGQADDDILHKYMSPWR